MDTFLDPAAATNENKQNTVRARTLHLTTPDSCIDSVCTVQQQPTMVRIPAAWLPLN